MIKGTNLNRFYYTIGAPQRIRLEPVMVGAMIIHNTGTELFYLQFHSAQPALSAPSLFSVPVLPGGVSTIDYGHLDGCISCADMWVTPSSSMSIYAAPVSPAGVAQLMIY